MTWEAWLAVSTILVVLGFLVFTRFRPELILLTALVGLFSVGVIDAKEALSGLANQGVITVAVLYIVVAGLKETGAVGIMSPLFLGKPRSLFSAQLKVMAPVTAMSAFLNNTPVVAMFIPTIMDWSRKFRLPASKLLIPLSYAAIFGGICTLIGTSTNLVVNGLLISYSNQHDLVPYKNGLAMFEIAKIGLPLAVAGMLYLLLAGRKILPDRTSALEQVEDPKEYTVEMVVDPKSSLVGQSIEDAGLRHLKGMFLMEIERAGELIVAVSPHERLHAEDRLVFVGVVESLVDLQKMPGLNPATRQIFKLDSPRSERCLVEVVVSNSFPGLGKTIRESRFRTLYNAVVIAVSRNGERIKKKIGDIVLQPGDALMVETVPSFLEQQKNSRDFYLINQVEDSTLPRFERAGLAIVILAGMVILAATGLMSMLNAALVAAVLMVLTRCASWDVARKSVDMQVLLVIVAAFGLGRALESTQAAGTIADSIITMAGHSPWLVLLAIYAITSVFTETITHNGAAVLMFPIGMAMASELHVSPMPFVITIMIAASASFATPIGYQTNLMVYGPGGYRFGDFLKIGIPLNLIFLAITVALVPWIWPF